MISEAQQRWIDKTQTAVGGASVLSQASAREVARHALRELFILTENDQQASLQTVQQISDFTVRRRLMEMFRRSFVEVSSLYRSEVFFQVGDFSDSHFADIYDRDLLALWQYAGRERAKFDALIKGYPNAARARMRKRLTSQAFARKRRIRYGVGNGFSPSALDSRTVINLLALLIFLLLMGVFFTS